MADSQSKLRLFQAYGVELEYMIVDRDSLRVKPIADELLKSELGSYGSDFENGMVTWSNELVLHVIELKCSKPEPDLAGLSHEFVENVTRINDKLEGFNAMLLPTAAHPFMNPATDTKLWPHDNNEVYSIYNKIFDCRGHGWSNLQSTHLNLPFQGDQEFAKLHAAIRLILPLLPALCASSPFLERKPTGLLDSRLKFYQTNQAKIPSITRSVIPEAVYSEETYSKEIYEKIKRDISPFNEEDILDPVWVNSRGAIPRFDRGSIEIRIMDIQECPSADLAIVALVVEVLKALVDERFSSFVDQMNFNTEALVKIFQTTVSSAQDAVINDKSYLELFSIEEKGIDAGSLWRVLIDKLLTSNASINHWKKQLDVIINQGSLSQRILKATDRGKDDAQIETVYRQLSQCLAQNKMFVL